MLIIKKDNEQYTITNDYKLLGNGLYKKIISSMIDLRKLETTPSSPCLIDVLYYDFLDLGFEILLYQQEFDENKVY